ncbi:MAG: deoxynucleoside kinase [Bacteroidia bacterium]
MSRYIAIEGNIGVGKTTLTQLLAERWQIPAIYERFLENPFLPRFYEDPKRYAFSVETAFLAERYRQMHDEFAAIDLRKNGLLADYSFYKTLIFAQRNLDADEYRLFSELFGMINAHLPQPYLFVYLKTDTEKLLSQISQRGRDFEKHITADYLEKIDAGYLDFMQQASGLRCLMVHAKQLDFVKQPEDFVLLSKLLEADYRYGITEITIG